MILYACIQIVLFHNNGLLHRGPGAGPAGTTAAGPMLEAKLMNLIKAGCRSSDSAMILA